MWSDLCQAAARAQTILYLADNAGEICFLFKVKCPTIVAHLGLSVGTHVLARSSAGLPNSGDCSDARMVRTRPGGRGLMADGGSRYCLL
jgi:hypothetical protein